MPYICDCGQKLDLIAALDALPADQMGSSGMFYPACRSCGQSIAVRLRNNGFEVGYSYFGGSMHFEVIKRVKIKEMMITTLDPDDLDVSIGSRKWHFGICHPSTSRYVVFQKAFAAGKQLKELDFAQWGVTYSGMHRNGMRLEYSPETVIEPNDFLYFSGPAPALTRVWLYMNDGKPRRHGT
jgi:hypothetical protein